jgi:hypothetical protein
MPRHVPNSAHGGAAPVTAAGAGAPSKASVSTSTPSTTTSPAASTSTSYPVLTSFPPTACLTGGAPFGQARAAFAELFSLLPTSAGHDISSRAREDVGVPDEDLHTRPALTYGETPLEAVFASLSRIEAVGGPLPTNESVFLDVGSGVGKPVFAAALLRPGGWGRVVGVEILEPLWEASLEVQETWEGGLPYLAPGIKETQYRIPKAARAVPVDLLCGDACAEKGGVDWGSVTVAYACSTCFDERTVARLAQTAGKGMREGTYLVLSSVELDGTDEQAAATSAAAADAAPPNASAATAAAAGAGETAAPAAASPAAAPVAAVAPPPPHSMWEVVDAFQTNMSWGLATVFVHRRRPRTTA